MTAPRLCYAACGKGHADCAQLLIAANATVDRAAERGYTPLHTAAGHGYRELVSLLLDNGARTDLRTAKGSTALALAEESGHTAIAALLRRHRHGTAAAQSVAQPRLSTSARGPSMDAAFRTACLKGNAVVLDALLREGGGTVQKVADEHGNTGLHLSCGEGRADCVQLLIAANVNVNQADNDGVTPLYAACSEGHLDCVPRGQPRHPRSLRSALSIGSTSVP